MSQPTLTDAAYSVFKKHISACAVVDIGASGAPTLQKWTPTAGAVASAYAAASTSSPTVGASAGTQLVKSIARNSTGDYTVTLQSTYQRLIGLRATFSVPSSVNSGKTAVATANVVTPSGGIDAPGSVNAIEFICLDFAGNVVDPASGEQMWLWLEIDDSGVV